MDYSKLSKEELIALLENRDAELYQTRKERDEALKKLEEVIEKKNVSRAKMFARKSEIRKNTFNEAEETKEKEENGSNKKGRKAGSKNFDYAYLESHVDETIYLEPEKVDESAKYIGEDVSYKISYIPGRYKITKIISKKYVSSNGKIYQVVKDDPFPHSICTASFVSQIMKDKFLLGIPYYRQAEYYYNEGIKISRQDLCNYQLRATEILEKYYQRLKYHLINNHAHVICADETTQKLVKEKKTGYVWVYLTSFYDNPIYVYEAALDRKAANAINFLKDYKGYLLTDAYPGYAKVSNVTNCYCWVHARRNFLDIIKGLDNKQKAASKSQRMVDMIDELLHLEKKWRDNLISPNEIKNKRNSPDYLERLASIKNYLDNIDASPSSPLGKARDYMLKRWDSFINYLKDGHIEMTNNISERAVKPFVIARKNFLFSFTKNGADSSAIYFSIQQTARANGYDPGEFTEMLLNKLKPNFTDEEIDALMPWNIKNTRTNG